uniref:E3 ubiquitin-protein ligase Godzilla-like isoform X1 n=1 Tax=Myxine glutinosa TaxID=7769 RepID=UPI00358FE250
MYIPVYSWGYTETTTAIPSVGLQDLPLNLVVFAVGSAVFVSVLSLIFCCHLFKLRLKAQREMKKYNEVIRKEKAQHFDAYETCAVCLEDFKVKDKLGICPCRHAFHKNTWFIALEEISELRLEGVSSVGCTSASPALSASLRSLCLEALLPNFLPRQSHCLWTSLPDNRHCCPPPTRRTLRPARMAFWWWILAAAVYRWTMQTPNIS